jgi:hypothetical protein
MYFQTKNTNLGKFWRALQWNAIWSILQLFGIFYGHLVYSMVVLVYLSRFGTLYQENLATLTLYGGLGAQCPHRYVFQ